jgi:hypothetical protein
MWGSGLLPVGPDITIYWGRGYHCSQVLLIPPWVDPGNGNIVPGCKQCIVSLPAVAHRVRDVIFHEEDSRKLVSLSIGLRSWGLSECRARSDLFHEQGIPAGMSWSIG